MGMDTVDLIMKVEDHFQIRIPNEEAARINTVADIYEVVLQHLAKKTDLIVDQKKIENEIKFIIADHSGKSLNKIEPSNTLTDDLGLD